MSITDGRQRVAALRRHRARRPTLLSRLGPVLLEAVATTSRTRSSFFNSAWMSAGSAAAARSPTAPT